MNGSAALKQYQQMGAQSGVVDASPHRLIQMLLQGALTSMMSAKGYMQQKEIANKGEQISRAISIVEALRNSLNFEKGGDIAKNLDALYEYIGRILLEANMKNDEQLIDEAAKLLNEIKAGWDGIAPQA